MKNSELVSVIVPVYNAEKHLGECIESITNQSYKNLEIILVNDGSSDNSITILKEYAQKDSRIIVVDKENEGVAKTRNRGIDLATGKYLVFSDSDDLYDKSFIEKAVDLIERDCTQYVTGAFETFDESGTLARIDYLPNYGEKIDIDSYLDVMATYQAGVYWGSNCARIFVSSIVKENNIYYESNVKFAEDFRFDLKYLMYVKEISLIHEPSYYYRLDTQNSLSKGNSDLSRYWREYKELSNRYKELYTKHGAYERNENRINKFILKAVNIIIRTALKNEGGKKEAYRLFYEIAEDFDIEIAKKKLKEMKLEHKMCYKALKKKKPFWLCKLMSIYNFKSRHK